MAKVIKMNDLSAAHVDGVHHLLVSEFDVKNPNRKGIKETSYWHKQFNPVSNPSAVQSICALLEKILIYNPVEYRSQIFFAKRKAYTTINKCSTDNTVRFIFNFGPDEIYDLYHQDVSTSKIFVHQNSCIYLEKDLSIVSTAKVNSNPSRSFVANGINFNKVRPRTYLRATLVIDVQVDPTTQNMNIGCRNPQRVGGDDEIELIDVDGGRGGQGGGGQGGGGPVSLVPAISPSGKIDLDAYDSDGKRVDRVSSATASTKPATSSTTSKAANPANADWVDAGIFSNPWN